MPSPLQTIHLRAPSTPSPAAVAIDVDVDGGVDLVQLGRALGLDPASVRLNGHFLSRGPGHVSAVTWRALLAFFDARGLPTGAAAAAPLAVHGKPSPSPSDSQNPSSKRKSVLEVESCAKKSKLQEDRSTLSKPWEELLSDDITLGLKRRLRLEETCPCPSKKTKQVEHSSESANGTQQPVKFSCSFINGHGKRPQEEIITSLSCKRVR